MTRDLWKQDTFYHPKTVIPRLEEFKKDAIHYAQTIWREQKYKDSNKDWGRREPTDKSLDYILDLCKTEFDVKICHRAERPGQPEKFEIVFVNNWYFAWMGMHDGSEEFFVDKYKLEVLK